MTRCSPWPPSSPLGTFRCTRSPYGGAGATPPSTRTVRDPPARRCGRPRSGCSPLAFFLATVAAIAVIVQGIPFLLERGYSPAFAAFSIGLIGVSQIPGRLCSPPLAERLPHPWRTVALFALIAAGIRSSSASTRPPRSSPG